MVNDSRTDINDYLYGLFHGTVSDNVYPKEVPTELTESDTTDGFVVIRTGDINDFSEFRNEAFAYTRCYVEVYVPVISRGRYSRGKYKTFEDAVNEVINGEIANPSSEVYTILEDGILSGDDDVRSDPDNRYILLVKSFLVMIDTGE